MKEFPSKKVFVYTLVVLFVYFNIRFVTQAKSKFYQFNYQWKKMKHVDSLGNFELVSASKTRLQLKNNPQKKFDFNNTYVINKDGKKNYFRYEYLIKKKDINNFFGVVWLNGAPVKYSGNVLINIVSIPLIEKAENTCITIGNRLLCRENAKYFRKYLYENNIFNFKGTFTDVYNLHYQAQPEYTSQQILNDIALAKPSDYYILFFDKNRQEEIAEFLANLPEIKKALMKNNPKKIFWVTLPKLMNNSNEYAKQINEKIKSLTDSVVTIIDAQKILGNNINNYADIKGRWLQKKAYTRLAEQIINKLNE